MSLEFRSEEIQTCIRLGKSEVFTGVFSNFGVGEGASSRVTGPHYN